MANSLKKLTSKLSPKVNAEATLKAAKMLTALNLAKLRRSRKMTQGDVAEALELTQPSVAQLEKRTDAYISTLQDYLHALGGELEITARFADGTKVQIDQFSQGD